MKALAQDVEIAANLFHRRGDFSFLLQLLPRDGRHRVRSTRFAPGIASLLERRFRRKKASLQPSNGDYFAKSCWRIKILCWSDPAQEPIPSPGADHASLLDPTPQPEHVFLPERGKREKSPAERRGVNHGFSGTYPTRKRTAAIRQGLSEKETHPKAYCKSSLSPFLLTARR